MEDSPSSLTSSLLSGNLNPSLNQVAVMNQLETFLEKTWDALLSRDAQRITKTFASLDQESQHIVLEHLKKMVSEDGWHPDQVLSAKAALQAIQSESQE
jgi:hypothetical protein